MKIQQEGIWQIQFNGKMDATTFDSMNLAFSWFDKVGCCNGTTHFLIFH
jgi:hypothetical protein